MFDSPTAGSMGGAVLPADRGDLRGEVWPGRKARARAPQVGSNSGDIGIAERAAESRHDDTRYSLVGADAAENDLDQIARVGKMSRAVEREIRACRERRAGCVVVTGGAGGSVEPRVGIER